MLQTKIQNTVGTDKGGTESQRYAFRRNHTQGCGDGVAMTRGSSKHWGI